MNFKPSLCFTAVFSILLLSACSGDDDTSVTPSQNNAESQLMGQTQSALSSATSLMGGTSSAGAGVLAIPDVTCDANGSPLDSAGVDMYPSTHAGEFGFAQLYCMGTADSGSPETALGAMEVAKTVLCVLGTVSYNGTEQSFSHPVSGSTCLSPDMQAEFLEDNIASLDGTYTADESSQPGWDYEIDMDMSQAGMGYMSFKYKNTGGIIATALSETDTGKQGAWLVAINSNSGEIRFEYMDERQDSDGWSRHARMFLECDINSSNYNCNNLTNAEGIWSNIHETGGDYYATIATLSGNPNDGFKTYGYSGSDNSSFSNLNLAAKYTHGSTGFDSTTDTSGCHSEASGTCIGNSGIVFTDNNLYFLLLREAGQDGTDGLYPSTWYSAQTTQPTYSSITTSLSQ